MWKDQSFMIHCLSGDNNCPNKCFNTCVISPDHQITHCMISVWLLDLVTLNCPNCHLCNKVFKFVGGSYCPTVSRLSGFPYGLGLAACLRCKWSWCIGAFLPLLVHFGRSRVWLTRKRISRFRLNPGELLSGPPQMSFVVVYDINVFSHQIVRARLRCVHDNSFRSQFNTLLRHYSDSFSHF